MILSVLSQKKKICAGRNIDIIKRKLEAKILVYF